MGLRSIALTHLGTNPTWMERAAHKHDYVCGTAMINVVLLSTCSSNEIIALIDGLHNIVAYRRDIIMKTLLRKPYADEETSKYRICVHDYAK